MYSATVSCGSPTSTARITTSFDPSSLCSISKLGISARHGAHHVAQKSTSTTLPLNSSSETSPPLSFGRRNAGADRPIRSGLAISGLDEKLGAPPARIAAAHESNRELPNVQNLRHR